MPTPDKKNRRPNHEITKTKKTRDTRTTENHGRLRVLRDFVTDCLGSGRPEQPPQRRSRSCILIGNYVFSSFNILHGTIDSWQPTFWSGTLCLRRPGRKGDEDGFVFGTLTVSRSGDINAAAVVCMCVCTKSPGMLRYYVKVRPV